MKYILEQILTEENIKNSINENLLTLLEIIPEISDMMGFDHKHPHHHLDVWNHTLLALEFSPNDFKVRLVLLLHDIGKPHSYQDLEVRHFKGHPKKSAEISQNILTRLKFEEDEIKEICYLIENHDFPIKDSFIEQNPTLAKTLFDVQFCDALAHNPTKLGKRIKYLLDVNEKVNNTFMQEIYKNILNEFKEKEQK